MVLGCNLRKLRFIVWTPQLNFLSWTLRFFILSHKKFRWFGLIVQHREKEATKSQWDQRRDEHPHAHTCTPHAHTHICTHTHTPTHIHAHTPTHLFAHTRFYFGLCRTFFWDFLLRCLFLLFANKKVISCSFSTRLIQIQPPELRGTRPRG